MRISDWSSDVCSSDLFLDEQVDLAVDGEIIRSRLLALRDAADLIVDGGGIGDRGARGRPGGQSRHGGDARKRRQTDGTHISQLAGHSCAPGLYEIGRASCRERGGKYVSISEVAV